MNQNWQIYQNALVWVAAPGSEPPSEAEARRALREKGTMFVRWTSDFNCASPTEWWYCLCDHFTDIESLKRKQRYRIRRGLANCNITRLEKGEIARYAEEVFDVADASFADYPAKYRPTLDKTEFCRSLITKDEEVEYWLCRGKQDDRLIGYGYCRRKDEDVYLEQVKVPTAYLDTDVNAALAYKITEYYLGERKVRYLIDGERNIRHETNYQAFLVQFIGFRYAYCRLHVIYSPAMGIAVRLLYPFRKTIERAGRYSSFLYNVFCTLKQEEIRRSMVV